MKAIALDHTAATPVEAAHAEDAPLVGAEVAVLVGAEVAAMVDDEQVDDLLEAPPTIVADSRRPRSRVS